MRTNYFNNLSKEEQLAQLAACRLMLPEEFRGGTNALKNKNIVILGCGSQGLNQGLNMRDSGLSISYALREEAIQEKRPSFRSATENGFTVGTFEELVPKADLVINLTPDKQHTAVVNNVQPLMKENAVLSYSHGFNIVEEGMELRKDITVIMVAPKCPGTEVREEYRRGFGVPTLIAVHPENDPLGIGLEWAKAYAYATGGHRAGVLESSFAAEVKSDLMGEQTILCGVLQTASILSFDKMISEGVEASYAARLVQYGWENITEALKTGGITGMMNRLSRASWVRAFHISEELKEIMRPLFVKHMEDILSGSFSARMMRDWDNNDEELLEWRAATGKTAFEKTEASAEELPEQEYYDNCLLMVAFVKSGVELAFETMVEAGIIEESAYFESLHEVPLIANTIARKKLFEMNRIISDTAEYGCYLFDHSCKPLVKEYVFSLEREVMGVSYKSPYVIELQELQGINAAIRNHPVEKVGSQLRAAMTRIKETQEV